MTKATASVKPRIDEEHNWKCWPQAETLVVAWIDRVLSLSPAIRDFLLRVERQTSSRVIDWLDYIEVAGQSAAADLESAGFVVEDVPTPDGSTAWRHPQAQLPRVVVNSGGDAGKPPLPVALALKCDRVADMLLANALHQPIVGEPLGRWRQATLVTQAVDADVNVELRAVERAGYRGFLAPAAVSDPAAVLKASELWATRQRHFIDDAVGMQQTLSTARAMVDLVGADAAASLAFAAERDYWQRRNHAAQVQKARQDRVGLGWGNQDHHTFRSSRAHFTMLVAILETFGFLCRERFYAGREAGWGAQILEQPTAGLVVFADVDLSADEVLIDFSHQQLLECDTLGTIGLWTGLHGESMLDAGMHHLEAQFNFDSLRDDLAAEGVNMMKPFSDLDHLRQAFTAGQRWSVNPERVQRLLSRGLITSEQADKFLAQGAIGSHLENLQRRYGFKGFNQTGINEIIRDTDPRR